MSETKDASHLVRRPKDWRNVQTNDSQAKNVIWFEIDVTTLVLLYQ